MWATMWDNVGEEIGEIKSDKSKHYIWVGAGKVIQKYQGVIHWWL